ncbi:MAG: hypothetical protein ACKVRO_08320 [Micropepsaceae bacterium]
MTIRVALIAFVLAAALAVPLAAAPVWNGAGWYVVSDTEVGPFVEKGPYASKEDCEAAKPANDDMADYFCDYLSTQPSWDD